jgi:hypothetical protein
VVVKAAHYVNIFNSSPCGMMLATFTFIDAVERENISTRSKLIATGILSTVLFGLSNAVLPQKLQPLSVVSLHAVSLLLYSELS